MTTPSDVTVSDQHGETWTPLPAPFSKYEWSPSGFGPDQRPIRRAGRKPLATTVNNHGGYLMVKVYDDTGVRQTKTVHSLILLGGAGLCPPGQESRHLDDDPLNNRWAPGATREEVQAAGGNLMYGTKPQNAADKYRNGRPRTAPAAAYPCINHDRCGGMVVNPGRRCLPCAKEVGVQAATMLNAGVNLEDVTVRLGYQTAGWVYKLAVDHGGYAESAAHARAQQPRWTHRVTATLRGYFGRGRR